MHFLECRITSDVADAGGSVAAMLAVQLEDRHLDQLFVSPEFPGQALGGRLLRFARTLMPDEIWLRTSTGNHKARAWYEREGFVLERIEDRPEMVAAAGLLSLVGEHAGQGLKSRGFCGIHPRSHGGPQPAAAFI